VVERDLANSLLSSKINNLTGCEGLPKYLIVRRSRIENGCHNGCCEKVRSRTLKRDTRQAAL
jgi:hypothetical protein